MLSNFACGQVGKVRVKHGITDVEYPDMPMGGWAGTIHEIHDDGMYTVRWSQETLAAIHPVFKKRCERDGMAVEEHWLADDDLELDEGGPLDIEHPTEIATKPLSPRNQDDRVRMVFGLTSNEPLPNVDHETRHNHNVVTLSLGEFEVQKGKPNRKLVADYCYWFWNWR